jgi:hypothetical protein
MGKLDNIVDIGGAKPKEKILAEIKELMLELIGPDNDDPDEGNSEAFIRGRQYERFIMRKEVEKL